MSILRDRLARDGVSIIMLATSVDNARAVRAYEKAGFVRRRQFVDNDRSPAKDMPVVCERFEVVYPVVDGPASPGRDA